jgi:TolB protein
VTELDRATLDRLLPPAASATDWDDVLRRSGTGRARRRVGLVAIAVVALAALTGAASAVDTVRTFFLGTGMSPKIAFVSVDGFGGRSGKVFVVGPDGAGKSAVTELPDLRVGPPAWSPDRKRIAYMRGGNDVYIANADGSGARKLRPNFPWRSPAWSPDGATIAVAGLGGIHVVDPDTHDGRRLTDHGGWPAWSPNGQMIAFVSVRDGNSEVYVMNANGSGQRNLTRNAAEDLLPAWSPDGRSIALVSNRDGRFDIYVMGADGRGPPRRVTNGAPQINSTLSWAPDGRRIAFEGRARANSNVYVANVDGSGLRNLTRGFGQQPQWSPDGRLIAFVKRGRCPPCPRPAEIYVMNADGSDQRNVTRSPASDDRFPVWLPQPRNGV